MVIKNELRKVTKQINNNEPWRGRRIWFPELPHLLKMSNLKEKQHETYRDTKHYSTHTMLKKECPTKTVLEEAQILDPSEEIMPKSIAKKFNKLQEG